MKQKRFLLWLTAAITAILMLLPLTAMADVRSGWLWPVPANRRDLSRGYFDGHSAVDFPRGVGTPVYASKDGIVVVVYEGCNNSFTTGNYNSCTVGGTCNPVAYVYNWANGEFWDKWSQRSQFTADGYTYYRCNYGFGRGVVIYHPEDGVVSTYAHMDTVGVTLGSTVKQGQQIGTVGARGNSWGAHLHFGICTTPRAGNAYMDGTWQNNNPISPSLGVTASNKTNLYVSNGYVYNPSGVEYIFDTVKRGYLDVNATLDGAAVGTLGDFGICDVYINGTLDASDVNDYYKQWPVGTTYEITDIRAKTGYRYNGQSSIKGTITSTETVNAVLSFSSSGLLEIGGYTDGRTASSVEGYGWFDVYINGELDEQNATSYRKYWPVGTAYEIRNVRAGANITFGGLHTGELSGSLQKGDAKVELIFTTNGTAITDWQYGPVLPGNLDPELLDVEYENIYIRESSASPGAGYVMEEVIQNEWVNDDVFYTLHQQVTSDALVEIGWHYYHFCSPSKAEYANYAQDSTYVHYDSIPDASQVTVASSGPDDSDPSIPYYVLNWVSGGSAYCSSGVTCDGSNGSHGSRSRVWYKEYAYQRRHKVEIYRWVKNSGWVSDWDQTANQTNVRWRLKGGIPLTPENITEIVGPDHLTLMAGESITLELSVKPVGIDDSVLTLSVDDPSVVRLEGRTVTALYSQNANYAAITVSAPNGVTKDIPVQVESNMVSDQWTVNGFEPGSNQGCVDVFAVGQNIPYDYSYQLINSYDPGYAIRFFAQGGIGVQTNASGLMFTKSGLGTLYASTVMEDSEFGRVLVTDSAVSMRLPANTAEIADGAFANVQARFFYLPSGVTVIGNNAFPEGSYVFLRAGNIAEIGQNPGVYFVETGSVYSNAFAEGRREYYLAIRGTTILPEWTDWSEWSTDYVASTDRIQVETRQQYRLAPVSTSLVYGDWSAWGGWTETRQNISDANLMQEQTRTVYPYYYFCCPHCGAHTAFWGNQSCYACGNYVFVDQGSFSINVNSIPVPKSACALLSGNKYYTEWYGHRYYYWDDGSSPDLQTPRAQYSYRTRTASTVTTVGDFGPWTDGDCTQADGFQVETRTLYRWRQKQ